MHELNVVLLIVDSLRAQSLQGSRRPATPFLDALSRETVVFTRAHATECWTLPTHMSMFTGLLPSQHGAHFQNLAYRGTAPTIAEVLHEAGYDTEVVTRNSIFDGTLPGVTRGFQRNTIVLSERARGWNPLALMLALSKPRFRRQIRSSGFFSALQREQREFLTRFSRAVVPADREALDVVHARMRDGRRRGRPYFVFANLYDVHAPYPPTSSSFFRPWRSLAAVGENLTMPFVLPYLGGHAYLRDGFRLSSRSRDLLRARYHTAIELMDAKLASFFDAIRADGLLDETVLIVASDHGEAFGDHGLYLHDASVYQTHLHVPLWVHHPAMTPSVVTDVVSTRDLFSLMRVAMHGSRIDDTPLDPAFRARYPVAYAEHFHYPASGQIAARFRHDLRAVIGPRHKAIVRSDRTEIFDLVTDDGERRPLGLDTREFDRTLRETGVPRADAVRATSYLAAAPA